MTPTRRTFLAGLSAMAVSPVVAACGAGGDSATDETSNPAASEVPVEEAAFPATVEHAYGSTTVESAPKRVVTVGLVEQDALLALGIVPVAVTLWFGEAPGQIFPWATDALGDAEVPEVLMDANGIEIEKIAALQPDLIIGQYAGVEERDYELLSQIAPTVVQPGDFADFGVPWEVSTLNIGTAIGKPEAAQALIDDVTDQIAQAAEDHPEFAGKRAACVTPFEGLFVYGPEDPRTRMLQELGFEFPAYKLGSDSEEFGVSISAERTADLSDLDTVVWLDLAAERSVESVFEKTTAFEEGRFVDISEADGAYYVGHSMVTPLSIPYVLERYVPQLVAALDGDPGTEPPAPDA